MPGQKITLNPRGLFTNVNALGKIPDGGLLQADNVIITKPGILQSRRGRNPAWFLGGVYNPVDDSYSIGPRPLRLFNAKLRVGGDEPTGWLGLPTYGMIIMLSDLTMMWTPDGTTYSIVQPTFGQTPLALGSVIPDRHWKAFEQNGTLYISTTSGIVAVGRPLPNSDFAIPGSPTPVEVQDHLHSGYYAAGVPYGLSMDAALDAEGSAIGPDSQVAYRFLFGYRDASGIPHFGAPTTRAVVINKEVPVTGKIFDVKVRTTIPPGIIPGRHFWQLYRTLPSPSADVDPGDDEGLIYEGQIPLGSVISALQQTSGIVTATISTPHDYASGQEIFLTSGVTLPGSTTGDIIAVAGGWKDNVWSPDRNIWAKAGNAGIWMPTGYTPFVVTDSDSNVLSEELYWKQLLLRSDPVTNRIYYIETGSPWIYVLSNAGVYLFKISLGLIPDQAIYDSDSRLIHLVGRSLGTNPTTFDYWNPTAQPRYSTFSTATDTIISATIIPPFPGGASSFLAAQITPVESLRKGVLGLWKATLVSTPWITIAVTQPRYTALGEALPTIIAGTGAAWSQYLITRIPGDTATPSNTKYTVSSGDSFKRADTNERITVIGIFGSVSSTNARAILYYLHNNGSGVPVLTKLGYEEAGNNTNQYVFSAVHTHRTTGLPVVIREHYNNAGILQDVFAQYFALNTWIPNANNPASSIAVPYGLWAYPWRQVIVDSVTVATVGHMAFYAYVSNRVAPLNEAALFYDLSPASVISINSNAALGPSAEVQVPPITVANGVRLGIYTVLSSPTPSTITFANGGGDFGLTITNIIVKIVSLGFIDQVAPTFIGPYIYTAPVVEGIINSNYPPPLSTDITVFRTYGFYANVTQPASVKISLLRSLVLNERVYVGASFATVGDVEDVQAKVFKSFTDPAISPQVNIQKTIASLANVVNLNYVTFQNVIIPVSAGDVSFATFFVRSLSFTLQAIFKHTDSTGNTVINTSFAPYNISVQPEKLNNVLYYSKTNIPDAVPLLNSIRIGQDGREIRRIVAARDSLFVFKDDGCFILRGYGPPWQVDPFDLTLHLACPDSAVNLDNAVYGLFTRGVFKVSDANVELLSLPIQDKLERYMAGELRSSAISLGFGLADNADHKYMLWLPDATKDNDENPNDANDEGNTAYTYDTFTEAWTLRQQDAYHAIQWKDLLNVFGYEEAIRTWTFDPVTYKATLHSLNSFPCIQLENNTYTDLDLNDGRRFATPNVKANPTVPHLSNYPGSTVFITEIDVPNRRMRFNPYATGSFVDKPVCQVKAGDWIRVDSITYNQGVAWSALIMNDAIPGEWFEVSADIWFSYPGIKVMSVPMFVEIGITQIVQFAPTFPVSPAATNHFSEYALGFRRAYWTQLSLTVERPIENTDEAKPISIIPFASENTFGTQQTAIVPLATGAQKPPPVNFHIGNGSFIRTYIPRDQQRGTVIVPGYICRVANNPCEVNGIFIVMTPGPTSFTRR